MDWGELQSSSSDASDAQDDQDSQDNQTVKEDTLHLPHTGGKIVV